jgi:hypothetical protein
MGCLLYLQSGEEMDTHQNSKNVEVWAKILSLLPLVLLLAPAVIVTYQAYFHCQMRLLHQSPKLGACQYGLLSTYVTS